jgi:hypothetical protein
MHFSPMPPVPVTVDAIFDAFPRGLFGVRGALSAARFAGHGSSPDGLTQIDIGFGDVRVQTARDQRLPSSLIVSELVFHSLVEAQLTYPLTLRIDRHERSMLVDTVSTVFDAYVLEGHALAVAAVDDVCVTVRCSEAMLAEVELTRLHRSDVEQIASATQS